MRKEWIICPGGAGSISSVNCVSKSLYCKRAVKIFDGFVVDNRILRLRFFFFLGLFLFFPDKNHFGKGSSGTECESICFLHFIVALEFKCRLLNTSLPDNS